MAQIQNPALRHLVDWITGRTKAIVAIPAAVLHIPHLLTLAGLPTPSWLSQDILLSLSAVAAVITPILVERLPNWRSSDDDDETDPFSTMHQEA